MCIMGSRNIFRQEDERIYQEVLEAVRWKQQEFEKQVNALCGQYDVKIDNPALSFRKMESVTGQK